jgi:hypothetical protein
LNVQGTLFADKRSAFENPQSSQAARSHPTRTHTNALEELSAHEMSYLTIKRLQYGESRAQDSRNVRPHITARVWMIWVQTEFVTRNYPVLTERRMEMQYPSVPPGEAAHFI